MKSDLEPYSAWRPVDVGLVGADDACRKSRGTERVAGFPGLVREGVPPVSPFAMSATRLAGSAKSYLKMLQCC